MARYFGLPIVLIAAILDASVMPELRVFGGAPDLLFLVVISWALLADVGDAMLWAVFGGAIQDTMSIAPVGASALGLVIVAFAADALLGDVRRTNLLVPPLVMGVGTASYHLVLLIVLRLGGHAVPVGEGLLTVTLPTVIYHVLLSVPVFRLMGLAHDWLTPRRVRLE
jgi:rod shape-determining protein MreD